MNKHAAPTLTLISRGPQASSDRRRPGLALGERSLGRPGGAAAMVAHAPGRGGHLVINGHPYRIARPLPSGDGREMYAGDRAGRAVLIKAHARLEAEATRRAPASVTAPYVENDQRYLVREWLDGHDLNAVLPFLDAKDRAPLLRKLADALKRLHDGGIVHGNLRAWNVWLTPRLEAVRLINFEWSVLDGEGYDPAHHGPRPPRDTDIDWEACESLERFVRARTRQPQHESAWRAEAEGGDLAGRLLAERTRIITALVDYAGVDPDGGQDPREVCYLRMPGGDDLFTVADRAGVAGQWGSRAERTRAADRHLRVAFREHGETLPQAGFVDLTIVAVGASDDETAFAEAAEHAFRTASDRALFVLSGQGRRAEAAMAVRSAARRLCPRATVETGTFGPWTRTPDYVLVDFDGPEKGGQALRRPA